MRLVPEKKIQNVPIQSAQLLKNKTMEIDGTASDVAGNLAQDLQGESQR